MIRVLAFVAFLTAIIMIILDSHPDKYGPTQFVYIGLMLWCFSGIWDHALPGRRSQQP